jgi:TonB family protein
MKAAVLLAPLLALSIPTLAAAQTDATPLKPGNGVLMPRVISEVKPMYTAEAMRARVQGRVMLEAVVGTDGTVASVVVKQPLHPQLDEQAVSALKKWRFAPGTKDGVAVPVQVEVELSFTLHQRGPALGSPEVFFVGGAGMTAPKPLSQIQPEYTADAREKGVQGSVLIDAVILADGTVGDTKVTRSLDPGLDAQALFALNSWRFQPGRKDGAPVPVQVTLEIVFALK